MEPGVTAGEAGVNARPSVEVRGVVKRYPMFARRRDRALALLGRTRHLTYLTALDKIDLEVRPGEAVGVIGDNGSGKSTLLKLIAGVSRPDEGEIHVIQPVAPILELGLGFHPEFTGRENAVLYGTLLGLPEEVMTERLEDVLAFAELGAFIDQPIRTYSSGMTARLAFAVATSVEPQVLVVDEALAVGDGAFQKKCIDRMVRFKEEGRAVLFCSHALYMVTGFCQRAVWLHQGTVRHQGTAKEVVEEYEAYLMQREKRRLAAGRVEGSLTAAPAATQRGRLTRVSVLDADGLPTAGFAPGAGLVIEFAVESLDAATAFHLGVALDSQDGRCLFGAATHWDGVEPLSGAATYTVRLNVPALPLAGGTFLVSAFLFDIHGLHIYDQVVVPEALHVAGPRWTPSLLHLDHAWALER